MNIKQMRRVRARPLSKNMISINIVKLFLLSIIGIATGVKSSISLADDSLAREYFINPKEKIETVIGAGELNRIYIDSAEITEVAGDESKYTLHWSGDRRNIFIFPKVEAGETIEISLIMPGGIAQDIRFTVGDCSARRIFIYNDRNKYLINSGNINNEIYSTITGYRLKNEIDAMMRSMLSFEKGKYYILDIRRILSVTKELSIRQEKAYRYKNLSGAILSVKNKTDKIVALEEKNITDLFNNVTAINLPQKLLSPKSQTQILVITEEIDNDI